MFKKALAALGGAALVVTSAVGLSLVSATAASADACVGSWSIGVGGLTLNGPGITGQESLYFNTNQRVGYNSIDPNAGVGELNRLVLQHRAECPGDHIKLMGHSGGALVVHRWVSAAQNFPNLNAILLSDPARAAGPGGPGFAGAEMSILPFPYSGTDANFGSIPVLEVCRPTDHICNSASDWGGYFAGVHGQYSTNAWDYSDWASGTWFN